MNTIDLESFLHTMSRFKQAVPDPSYRNNARIRILNQLDGSTHSHAYPYHVSIGVFFRRLAALGSAFALLGTGMVYASQSSAPGNALYPVKRASEKVASSLAPTEQLKTTVVTGVIDRRAEEISHAEDAHDEHAVEKAVVEYKKAVTEATQSSRVDLPHVEEHIDEHTDYVKKIDEHEKEDRTPSIHPPEKKQEKKGDADQKKEEE